MPDNIAVSTRTGNKIHAAAIGGSTTLCGHWLRVNAAAYKVGGPNRPGLELVTCQRCLYELERQANYTRRDAR